MFDFIYMHSRFFPKSLEGRYDRGWWWWENSKVPLCISGIQTLHDFCRHRLHRIWTNFVSLPSSDTWVLPYYWPNIIPHIGIGPIFTFWNHVEPILAPSYNATETPSRILLHPRMKPGKNNCSKHQIYNQSRNQTFMKMCNMILWLNEWFIIFEVFSLRQNT